MNAKQNIPKELIYNIVKLNFCFIKCSSSMLVCPFTGLSYIDICELTRNEIRVAFDDNLWIIKKRHKTKVTSNIRLLDIPKAILNKYEGKLKNGQLLPVITNQKMNIWAKLQTYVTSFSPRYAYRIHTNADTRLFRLPFPSLWRR